METVKHYQANPMDMGKYLLGESPFYDKKTATLSWVDITAGKFYRCKDGAIRCLDMGEQIGAAVPTETPGTYLIPGTTALFQVDDQDRCQVVLDLTKLYDADHRSNDAKLDPRGRLFFGSSALRGPDGGNLYLYDHGIVTVQQPDTRISNGMAWSADRKHFFFSDSLFYQVFRYDYDEETGRISNRQALFDTTDGVPDGMTIDEKERLWVAIWGGRRIECHDSTTGALLAQVDVPAEHVSSCCFLDDKTLFITSSGDGLVGETDGCLFTCALD